MEGVWRSIWEEYVVSSTWYFLNIVSLRIEIVYCVPFHTWLSQESKTSLSETNWTNCLEPGWSSAWQCRIFGCVRGMWL